MDVILGPLLWLILQVLDLYMWVVIIGVILSWLVSFRVINTSNRFVYLVMDLVVRLTEPALRPIRNFLRRFLPDLGGIDISPVALILLLVFAKRVLVGVANRLVY